jgi:LacI family transcriptional regulator
MSVTAKEIASRLGVSAATVSMVLNNRPGIGEPTKQKILDMVRELGYEKKQLRIIQAQPQSLNLVIYKKHGDVVSDTPFFAELIQGIELQTRRSGFNLLVSYFYESQNHDEQFSAIIASSCRGIILLATEMISRDMEIFSSLRIPLVILDNSFGDINRDSVTINNIRGSSQAVKYLEQSGHTRIGHLRSSVNINNFYERREGYLRALHHEVNPVYTVAISSTSDGAYRDMKKYLASNPEIPSAFFADNDIIAISCIRALREAGRRIPDDVSIIGFDDIPASAVVDPPLSTMRVPKKSLGILAVERLIKQINGESSETVRIAVNTELVVRSSVKQLCPVPQYET